MSLFAGLFSSPCCTLSRDPGRSIDSSRGYVPRQYGCELIYFMLNPEVKINLIKGEFTFILSEERYTSQFSSGKISIV